MFIEFETYSEAGRTMLNVRHIVQIEKSNTFPSNAAARVRTAWLGM